MQSVTTFDVHVRAQRAEEHPRVFTSIHVTYLVAGTGLDPAAVERAIELSEARYCPAQAMLVEAVPITQSCEIRELPES